MFEVSFRGGARAGWVNASWPFATLTANADRLTLSSLGSYSFTPAEVVSLEPYGFIPVFASGIRINHSRRDYPQTIIFWCLGSRSKVLQDIAGTGFHPAGSPLVRPAGFPLRWSAVAVAILLWNALLLLDFTGAGRLRPQVPGVFALLALILAFGVATATQFSSAFQRIVLRESHAVGEIKPFLVLLQIVSGILTVGFALTLVTAG